MPKPRSSYQSADPPFEGMKAAVNPNYNAGNSRWFHSIVVKTADYQILESDFGKTFVNAGATAAVILTLPAVTNLPDGWWCRAFGMVLAQDLTLASSGSSDNLVTVNDLSADSVKLGTANERAGGGFEAVWDDTDSKWLIFTMTGEVQTVTIA
jgi:hypothetical protein